MNRHRTLIFAAATLSAALGALSCGDGTTEPPPDPPRPTTVTVSPATVELTALGTTEQLRAQVLDQYGQVMAGAAVSWSSSAASVAAVDASGLVTAAGNGAATITATAGSASGTAAVTVAQRVSMVEVSPTADTVVERDTVRFEAVAVDANGHAVAGAEFTWASGDTSVAMVDASGLVTGTGAGEVEITATSSGVAGRGELVVEVPVPTAVTVAPDTMEFTALGDTVRLMAEVRDQIGRVMEGEPVAWASGDTTVAAVDSAGLVAAAGNGAATISATAGEASGEAGVTVMQSVTTVEVSPAADTVVERDTVRFEAVAVDANGHAVVGAGFTWASGDTSVAVVDEVGLVTGTGAGEVEITATSSGVTGGAQLTVVVPAPTTVAVTPDTVALTALGQTVQLAAEVLDQAGRVMEGVPVAWSSGDTMVAAVDSAGLVTAAGGGATVVTATAGSASGEAVVTVMQSAGSVVVSPPVDTVALGGTLRLVAEAFDANGHLVESAAFTWSSSDGSVATVDASGLVRGVGEGKATLTATAGSATGTAEITVTNPDRAALVALYHATDGPNWVNNENWLADAPLGVWYGVGTDGRGRVVRLNLGGIWNPEERTYDSNNLSGPIPPELASLTNLRDLNLSDNALSGPIPTELASLTNLRELDLEYNVLSGPIPTELGNLASLTRLNLGANTLSGVIPTELGNLTNLQQLELRYNALRGPIPTELSNLASLTWLSLHWNFLSGPIPPELGSLTNLRLLSLESNALSGPIPPELGSLTNLWFLGFGGNNFAGPLPPELGNLSRLGYFVGFANPRLFGPLPETYTGLESLKSLSIKGTDLCIPQTTEFQLWLQGIENVEGEDCAIVEGGDRESLAAIYRWTNGDGWRNNDKWLDDGPLDDWYGVTADSTDRVTALDLSDNNLAGIVPAETGNLSYVEALMLNGNSALGGELSLRMLQLVFLSTLRLDGTGVCASAAPVFLDWLERIADARVAACPDDHGNDASGATSISVGERAQGELESYLDEDWFRVQVAERGTLTMIGESNSEVYGELYDAEGTRVGYDGWPFGEFSFSISRHVTPGTYYVRVTGRTKETRGSYNWVSSFEPRTPGVRAYLTQAVQSHDFAVPLVAGEDALLRVFVMADDGVTASMPPVRARFYQGEREVHSVWIDGSSGPVPHTMAEGDLEATANALIPGEFVVPGTEMVVDVDPNSTLDPSLGIGGRIPEEGRLALGIRSVPDFDVTAVPFLWAEDPDSSGLKATIGLTADHDAFYETREWLPIARMTATVREPVLVDYDPKENMHLVLRDVRLLLVADGAPGYYMAVPPWKDSGVLGIAFYDSRASVSRFEGHTIAHEFGHNFLLRHAPCGGPAGADGQYPHSGGRIGAWGYDFRDGTLVDPGVFTDLMTYCRTNDWISDYSFTKAVGYRTETQAMRASHVAEQVLVVRGGIAGGRLDIQPAFVLDAPPTLPEGAGPYRLVGSDPQGGELFALRFDMQEVADPEAEGDAGFTFAIPVQAGWAEALATLTLTGPEGSVALARDDPRSSAAALVLNAATGRIQAILRDPPVRVVAADRLPFALAGTVTLFSRGIPDPEAWKR